MRKLVSTTDEIELHCGSDMARHLVNICNIRIFYPEKEILLFDDDSSGMFHHVKLHPRVAAAQENSIGQSLLMPIGLVFGSNIRPHN